MTFGIFVWRTAASKMILHVLYLFSLANVFSWSVFLGGDHNYECSSNGRNSLEINQHSVAIVSKLTSILFNQGTYIYGIKGDLSKNIRPMTYGLGL